MILDGVRINYGIYDRTIDDDTITSVESSGSDYSDYSNTTPFDVNEDKDKITYLEKNYFLLDGSHTFPESGESYNVGWESGVLSNSSGVMNQYIEYIFQNTHDSYGVEIRFPDYCAAKDFKIDYYKDNTLVGSRTVTNNTLEKYTNYDNRIQWNRVRLTFTKVNPQQRARIWYITLGINDFYDEDVLISAEAIRKTDLTGNYDYCGEFSFEFFNSGRFDIHDITEFPINLQEGQKTIIYVKAKGSSEYVPFGQYYSETTEVSENGRVVKIYGYDELYNLNDTVYKKGKIYPEGRSLYDWAQEVAEDAGISITIDEAFQNIISTGYITEVPHREALRLIAEAGNGMLIVDKNGKILLDKHVSVDNGTLNSNNVVETSFVIDSTNKTLGVTVVRYTFSAASEIQELGHLDSIVLTSTPQEIEIAYTNYPVVTSSVTVSVDESSSAQISNLQIYGDRCIFQIKGTEGDTTFINVNGKPYNSAMTTITRGSVLKNIKTIENNYLITGGIGDNVADHQYERLVNKYNYTMETVTEKQIELGDKIQLDVDEESSRVDAIYVTEIGFELSAKKQIETIGGVDE